LQSNVYISSSIQHVNDLIVGAWEEKTAAEAASWIPRRPSCQLIVPSGSIDVALKLSLHWPSMTIDCPEKGEVLDASNPCIDLLMQKLPSYANTLWTDAFLRRETKDAFAAYAEENEKANKPWIEWVQSTASGKVRLIFGQCNEGRFERDNKGKYEIVNL
jgi:hypothetical protein